MEEANQILLTEEIMDTQNSPINDRRYSINTVSDGIKEQPTINELKKKLKILKNAIKAERKAFQQYKDRVENCQQNQPEIFVNGQQQQQQKPKFEDFDQIPNNSGIRIQTEGDVFSSTNRTQVTQSLKSSVGTERLLYSTQHFLNSGMAKFYKSPENLVEENGEVYDFFYSMKQIKLLKNKLTQKLATIQDMQQKISLKDKEIQELRNIHNSPVNQKIHQEQYEELQHDLDETQELFERANGKVKELQDQYNRLQEQNENLASKNVQQESQLSLLNHDIQSQEQKINKLQDQQKQTESEKKELEEQIENQKKTVELLKNQNDEISQLNFDANQEYTQNMNYTQVLETNIGRLNAQIRELKDKYSEEKKQNEKLLHDNQYKQLELEKKQNEVVRIQNKFQDQEHEIQQLRNSFRSYEIRRLVNTNNSKENERRLQTESGSNNQISQFMQEDEPTEAVSMFLRVNEFQEYLLHYESQKAQILIPARYVVSVKVYDNEEGKHTQFSITYIDNSKPYGQDRVKVVFQCSSKEQFEEVTSVLERFVKEARMEWKERQKFIRQQSLQSPQQQYQQKEDNTSGNYIRSLFKFFGSAEKY